MEIKLIDTVASVTPADWNNLTGTDYPFYVTRFSQPWKTAVQCPNTGWTSQHLLAYRNDRLVGLMPLFLKDHSQGEFVFDHQWASAHHRLGIEYYPKWLTAIPFTPCADKRAIVAEGHDQMEFMHNIFDSIKERGEKHDVSSWHCLFPELQQAQQLEQIGLSLRYGIQFQWRNRGYRDFTDFLEAFKSSKRKQVKKERRRVMEQGITLVQIIMGSTMTDTHLSIFYRFYQATYLKHGMSPYLNLEFFRLLQKTMPEQLLLVLATKAERPVGAALSFIGKDTLYGRYWGCLEEYENLHFEACYYQGLEYCIEHGLKRFDSGAQGEHKIARGFEPVLTYSAHWLKDRAIAEAVARFLKQELEMVELYKQHTESLLPFKMDTSHHAANSP